MADGELSNECGKYSHTSAVLVVVLYYLVCRNEWNRHDACMEQDRVDVPVMVYTDLTATPLHAEVYKKCTKISHSSFTSNKSLQEVRTKW